MMESAYPRVRELLSHLLGLTTTEQELPLNLLVRMGTPALRSPLENLAARVQVSHPTPYRGKGKWANIWRAELEANYPNVVVDDYAGNLDLMYAWEDAWSSDDRFDAHMRQLSQDHPYLVALINEAVEGWVCYDPMVTAHQLTWDLDHVDLAAEVLETTLALCPAILPMLVDMAKKQAHA